MTGLRNLETDIGLARQHALPVLITAPPDRALPVAHAIAAGGNEKQKTLPVMMFDGPAIVSAALGERWAKAATTNDVVLVVREVHALSDTEQAALMLLLYDGQEAEHRRIIATSSVCLFDRVEQRTFNASLFYRLNAIHIVSQSCSDRATATRPCCCDGADDFSWGSPEARFGPF